MKKILFAVLMSLPLSAMAVDTPTPDPRRSGDSIRVLYKEMTTVLPTAVPTAFITPAHVVNSSTGIKFQSIQYVNKSNCDVVISYDGATNHQIIPAQMSYVDDLAADKRYFQGSVYVRAQGACTSGNLYISGRY